MALSVVDNMLLVTTIERRGKNKNGGPRYRASLKRT